MELEKGEKKERERDEKAKIQSILDQRRLFPNEVIHPEEKTYDAPQINILLKVIVAAMVIGPGAFLMFFHSLFKDFMVS